MPKHRHVSPTFVEKNYLNKEHRTRYDTRENRKRLYPKHRHVCMIRHLKRNINNNQNNIYINLVNIYIYIYMMLEQGDRYDTRVNRKRLYSNTGEQRWDI